MAIDPTNRLPSPSTGIQTPAVAPKPTASFFRTLMSDLNPLQYIPVVGAIYRAVTGDQGDPNLRFVASLGTSFAIGGPIGVGITIAEKITGIDPEAIGRHLFSALFHPAASSASPSASEPGPAHAAPLPAAARPWSSGELAAYGIRQETGGELAAGSLTGADILNTLELRRLSGVA